MLQNSFSANNVTATNELWFQDMCLWIYILENLSFSSFLHLVQLSKQQPIVRNETYSIAMPTLTLWSALF